MKRFGRYMRAVFYRKSFSLIPAVIFVTRKIFGKVDIESTEKKNQFIFFVAIRAWTFFQANASLLT